MTHLPRHLLLDGVLAKVTHVALVNLVLQRLAHINFTRIGTLYLVGTLSKVKIKNAYMHDTEDKA